MTSETSQHRLSSTRRQVVAEIVRLVTPEYPELDDAERARVLAAVTGFVASQIEGIPSFIALPYRIAITAFDWLPILRHGCRFLALDEERKRTTLASWSDSRIGPFSDFIKLIRSCTMLAYFDHPDVTKRLAEAMASPPARVGAEEGKHGS